MIEVVYVEDEAYDHPRVAAILERCRRATIVRCARYGEVFNRRAQNFRLQKQRPALILARKFDNFVLEAPSGYGIGGINNYYFSHMLNCVYDCRYCFLQGMFRSAHYVLFVNYEDFTAAIDARLRAHPDQDVYLFSGYDCDSLALDSMTRFTDFLLPFADRRPRALIELRTKSVQVDGLLERWGQDVASRPGPKAPPPQNVVVAFSLTPALLAAALEHGAPPVSQRIDAMAKLAAAGWRIGLRFDPLIDHAGFRDLYAELMRSVFERVPLSAIHSVSLGPLRFPKNMYDRIVELYPDEPLFAGALVVGRNMVSYKGDREAHLRRVCRQLLSQHVDESKLFDCLPEVSHS